jgi:hypothetical protein
MFGSKHCHFFLFILLFFPLAGCVGIADDAVIRNEHAQSAPVPHEPNVLKGRLHMDGSMLSLRVCSDTFLLVLDTKDEKVAELLETTNISSLDADTWYVELDGRTEGISAADSLPGKYAASILLYDVLSTRIDTSIQVCQ